jgi:hypothetical protein
MVTEEQITEAERVVEAAERKLDLAEDYHERAGGTVAIAELQVARAAAHGARDQLRFLRSRFAAERASEARREQAEKTFSVKRREALTQRMADARDEAVHAIANLEKAAGEALAAVTGYAALVRETAGVLVGAGLRVGEGGEDGGGLDGSVHLGGERWRGAEPGSVVAAVLQGVVAGYDGRHPLAQLKWGQLGGVVEKAARDALLERAAGR